TSADIDRAEVAGQRLEIRKRDGTAESQGAVRTVLADILDLVRIATAERGDRIEDAGQSPDRPDDLGEQILRRLGEAGTDAIAGGDVVHPGRQLEERNEGIAVLVLSDDKGRVIRIDAEEARHFPPQDAVDPNR